MHFDGGRDFSKPSFGGKQSFGDKPMFPAVCDTCNKGCQVPFRPTGEKPVYCRDCFGVKPKMAHAEKSQDATASRLASLERKIDEILELLNGAIIQEEEATEDQEEFVQPVPEALVKKTKAPKKESKKKKTAKAK